MGYRKLVHVASLLATLVFLTSSLVPRLICWGEKKCFPPQSAWEQGYSSIILWSSLYGSGCQTQEKVVAASAHTFIVIADDSKQSTHLGEKVNVFYVFMCA